MKFNRSVFDVDTLASQLQDEGAKPFVKSSNELIDVIASKGLDPKKAS